MISGEGLRELMRRWASGVSLVTASDAGGPHGMTVSSFSSLSLDPALVMVSLERGARTHRMVDAGGGFAVVFLKQEQRDLAERFAGGVVDLQDRFAGVSHEASPAGHPLPVERLAYLDCQVVAAHPAGTHTVFIGEVVGGEPSSPGNPLIYFNRNYRRLES